jgi:hypothetical protein
VAYFGRGILPALGEGDGLAEVLAEGLELIEAEGLAEAEGLELIEAEGLAEMEGEMEAEGLSEIEGEIEAEGLAEAEGLKLIEAEGLALGEDTSKIISFSNSTHGL